MNRNDHDRALERYLSGELTLEDLPEDLREDEVRFRELLEAVKHDEPAPGWLRVAVMDEIRRTSRPAWKRAWDWFTRPLDLRFSPAMATGLAAAVALILVLRPSDPPVVAPDSTAVAPQEQVVTRFVFVAPQAASVTVTGDFAGWDPDGVPLRNERGTGVWTADVPLPPGLHEYAFVVDGTEWRPDPTAVSQVDDGFGCQNSVLYVTRES